MKGCRASGATGDAELRRGWRVRLIRPICAMALVCLLEQVATAQQAPSPQNAPGQSTTEEDLAARALDRTLVTTGAVLLPSGLLEVEPEFLYTRSEQSAPGLFTNSTGAVYVSDQLLNQDVVAAAAQLRLGIPYDTQLELYLPYAYAREQRVTTVGLVPSANTTSSVSGIGDVNLGIAKTLLTERAGWPNLVARVNWDSDTGRTDAQGLSTGTGFNEAQVSLIATKRQDPLVFLGGPYYEKSFEARGVRPGDKVGFSVGAALATSPETSLRVLLNQEFQADSQLGGATQPGSSETIGFLTIGASMTFAAGTFLDFTIQDGLTRDAPKLAVGVGLSKRFNAWSH
jgi:hypothetical protein